MVENSQNTSHPEFTKRLRFCASKVGNMSALAKKSGVSASTLTFYLKGGEPNRLKLVQIAKGAGVDVGWLCDGESRKERSTTQGENSALKAPERVTEALRKLAVRFGGAAGLAEISSLPETRVGDLIEGADPTASEIDRLSEASQLPITALFYPQNVPGESGEAVDPTTNPVINDDPFDIGIPLVMGLDRDEAGHWSLRFDKARARVPAHWIRDGVKYANIQTLAVFKVVSDDMEPRLKEGQLVVVDIGDKRPLQGIKLVRMKGLLTFADVLIHRGEEIEFRWEITPNNSPNPNKWPLDRLGSDIEIMGRIVNVIGHSTRSEIP